MYRIASGRNHRHSLPSVNLPRAATSSTVASPARKDLASAVTIVGVRIDVGDGGTHQRVLPCASRSAWTRGGAHAVNAQFFTIPWGNPREAIEPEGTTLPSLEHSAVE